LAAVSFCDLAFLLVMLPHALSSYDTLAFNDVFRFFYLRSLLTLYHHFEYDCTLMEFCNGSQLIDFCYYAGEKHPRTFLKKELILPSEVKKVYMRVMTIFNALL
ncbi:hypothetical protein TELCIR_17377, partial [Teladorsagia circumcincta]